MIEFKNLCAGYGGKPVIEDVSLKIKPGMITAIIGANGCGKSTLLKSVIGLSEIYDGEIFVDGKNTLSLSRKELAKCVAYLPQSKKLPDMTVGQMVLHGRFAHLGYPRHYGTKDFAIAQAAMQTMEISHLCEKPLCVLSGGTRQKAYIAMALAQQSPYILLDEPTTFLDISHRLKLCEILISLAKEGKGVAVVVHDLETALRISHRVAVMKNGRITAFGTPDEVVESDALSCAYGVEITKVPWNSESLYSCKLIKNKDEEW